MRLPDVAWRCVAASDAATRTRLSEEAVASLGPYRDRMSPDAYRQALSLTTQPRRVLEICNRLALCLVKQGKLDQAAAAIRQAETAAAPELAKQGPKATSLRRALDRMSGRKALHRARDKASGAHRDAQDAERGR